MLFLYIIASYLIGSIPFGFIAAKIRGIDIRLHGSGNIGATNVWRTIGPGAGLAVLALDAAKGAAAVFIGRQAGLEGLEMLTGIAALVGHAFPVYLGFKGGKIIATGAGVLLALAPPVLLIALTVFIIVVLVSRYVSLGSVCAALSVPLSMFLLHYSLLYIVFGGVLCLFAVLKHIPNLKRLARGTESKISFKTQKH
ncbi:MAG: glycerol-3-phosphate 1-O-acyltransferase PlsY [Actinobacteria bacterium]|nr:glycerol-3-phosphate 1-O-acyltransferase PlsY [Actinomycetota bacterium]